MKKIQIVSSFIFLMTFSSLCHGQPEKFELNLQGRVGMAQGSNTFESDFSPRLRRGLGLHAILDYNGRKFGFTSGIGIDNLAFNNRVDYFIVPQFEGHWTFGMAYFAIQVPALVSYRPLEKLKILGGINLMWANWNEHSASYYQIGPSPDVLILDDESLGDSQQVVEWMAQVQYSLIPRLSLGIFAAGSLQALNGVNHTQILSMDGQEIARVETNFRYNWLRAGLSLNYALFQSKSR